MTEELRVEERRLRRVFAHAIWIALAAPVTVAGACGDALVPDIPEGSATGGASIPATTGAGGSEPVDGGGDENAEADAPPSIFEAGCEPVQFFPEPRDPCGIFVRLPCGLPSVIDPGGGGGCYLLLEDCNQICPTLFFNCHAADESCDAGVIASDPKGAIDIDCSICNGAGRIPAGLARATMARPRTPLGAYFAVASHLEAASVHAFRRLRRELDAHRAPAGLLRAARRAERDEVRHARTTARLARRFGGAPVRPRVAAAPTRSLEEVAIENATEGCVRETYGALVAGWQAARATDREVADAMKTIERDETRHAALSWSVARWAWDRLDDGARRRLVEACRGAVESLRREAEGADIEELSTAAGLPRAAERRALLGALETSLWTSFGA